MWPSTYPRTLPALRVLAYREYSYLTEPHRVRWLVHGRAGRLVEVHGSILDTLERSIESERAELWHLGSSHDEDRGRAVCSSCFLKRLTIFIQVEPPRIWRTNKRRGPNSLQIPWGHKAVPFGPMRV